MRFTIAIAAFLAPALALAQPAPVQVQAQAQPELPRFSFSAALGAGWVTDRSLDFVSATDTAEVGDLRLGWAPGWDHRRIELNLGYSGSSYNATTFGNLSPDLAVRTLQLGATYRRILKGPLEAYGRLAGLYDLDTLSLSAGSDALAVSQTAHTFGAQLGAGAEAVAIRSGRVQVAFFTEVAYALRFSAAKFDQLQPDVGGARPAPVAFTPVNAGSVNLSGFQWRLGAALRF